MWGYRQKGSGAGSGENISDIAPWLDPARPARLNLIRVLGQQDVTSPARLDPARGQAGSVSER